MFLVSLCAQPRLCRIPNVLDYAELSTGLIARLQGNRPTGGNQPIKKEESRCQDGTFCGVDKYIQKLLQGAVET